MQGIIELGSVRLILIKGEISMRSKHTKNTKGGGSMKSTAGKSGMSQKITKRIVDARRHTQGYVVGGKEVSVPQARKMAAAGCLRGVQVVGQHIQSLPGKKRLSELPMMIKK